MHEIDVTPPRKAGRRGARGEAGWILFLLLVSSVSTSHAQRHFGVHSYGIHVGSYNPSFDAWEGTVWDFGPATMVGIDMDLDMARRVRLRVGVSAGSTAAQVLRDPGVGNEELRYRFVPLGTTLIFHTDIGGLEAYGGAGIELMRVTTTYESSVDRSKISGSAFLPHVLAGLRIPVVERLSLSVQVKQVLGTYNQQFQLEQGNSVRVTQPIEMNGLHWSVGFRLQL